MPAPAKESDSDKGRHTHTSCQLASRVITGVRILVAEKPNSCWSGLVQFVLKPTLLPLHVLAGRHAPQPTSLQTHAGVWWEVSELPEQGTARYTHPKNLPA